MEAPRFYLYLSARKNLELVAALDGGDAGERIEDALDTVDLTGRQHDKVRGYSHGMKQRLGIAGALLRDPKLLLLDEPTTGLDPAGMRDMRALVHRLAEDGLTVLLSSHLMSEVEDLCDRVAIVSRGRVVYEGALDELIATTAGRYDVRTTDDAEAAMIARRAPGIRGVTLVERRDLARGRRDRGRAPHARPRPGRHRPARARPQDRDARGAVLPHDRRRSRHGARAAERARASPWASSRRSRRAPCARPASMSAATVATRTIYSWELRKLAAQKRTYIGLGFTLLIPLIFIASLLADSGGPEGIPFADSVRESGLAIPLVGLFFGAFWFFPLVTALVAGDIVAAEDGNGTLKTILTRSADRWQIFVAKILAALTYSFGALVLFVLTGTLLGGIFYGFDPLVSLSGTEISMGRSLLLVGGATLAYALPDLRRHLDRDPALDHDEEQLRGRRHDPDAVADHAAAGDHLGARLHPPLPPPPAVQRLAGPAARADRLGPDHPRRLGLRPCSASPALRGRSLTFCAETSLAGNVSGHEFH